MKTIRSPRRLVRHRRAERTIDILEQDNEMIAPKPCSGDKPEMPALAGANEVGNDISAPRPRRWNRVLAYGVLPGLVLVVAMAASYLKWVDSSQQDTELARMQSVQAATDGTAAMLSYHPETAEKDLTAARDRLTGPLKDSYAALIHDVVIPGAKQKQISTVAAVPAAASVSASAHHAVVLVFVNQTVTMGNEAPTNTASSVRVTLDRVNDRWMIAGFDPI